MAVRPVLVLACLGTVLAGCTFGEDANVRLLNVSTGYGALDLYADGDRQLTAVASGAISSYSGIDADATEFSLARNGSTSTLVSLDAAQEAGDHLTLVAYGTLGNAGLLAIDEEKSEPDAGEAKLRVYNAAWSAGDLDVYLTSAEVAVDDVSPDFSSIEPGEAGEERPTVFDSGTYRLRVLAAGSKTDLRLDLTGFALPSRSVINVVLSDTTGGVLVDAWQIPQQESATRLANTMARLRAVVGLSDGAGITVVAGDATLVASAPATTLSNYQTIEAGSVELAVTVAGTVAHAQELALQAGHDYSAIVFGATADVQSVLAEDDNTLPDDDTTRVRVVNVMSALQADIDLLVDYYPLVQGTGLGEASAYQDLTPGEGLRLDVVDGSSTTLYTMPDVDLGAASVYSVFAFGGADDATGLVREDR